jgi:hypothetical protein
MAGFLSRFDAFLSVIRRKGYTAFCESQLAFCKRVRMLHNRRLCRPSPSLWARRQRLFLKWFMWLWYVV